ncbi:hypothetical protein PFICI_10527 [Pestalotiopsis fici W106-1]|uniref:Ribosome quality control complex subunit 2 n=1 Tax=Pestalotiopsis fici (strain W106-1 / CGMCC3.15140) TaxID=1229662 RepID=W3WX87_PESFW|nr:uncharacterized protein PFICI_10527 [Pestalotiopsis fici W106-1]ETS78465.1 hypothetical protein PFICI_10527 [Pestalotiopsis fici W106-1]
MKQRFSSLDVKVIAHELSASLVSLRVSNIYDLSSKILLLKFAKPDNKKQLLIDSGFRCHLTDFARTTAAAPSVFVQKLRKYLKTRRLTSVSQIGTDRIIEFQFSDGQYRLYLEFFASGNVILTDSDLKILTLLRNVPEGEGQEPQRVGLTYSLENRQNYGGIPDLTKERVRNALQIIVSRSASAAAAGKKVKKKPGDELRKGLATTITELPPILVDHALKTNGFDTTAQPASVLENDGLLDLLLQSLQEARKIVGDVTSSDTCKGYIFAKSRPKKPEESTEEKTDQERSNGMLYEDFHPFIPKQFQEDPQYTVLDFENYNLMVDEFFSSIEGQKLESKLSEREAAAKKKLEAARADQAKRIEGLQEVQTLNMRKASAIQANVERVQEAIDAVNGLIAQGMDWVDIGKLIDRERLRKNPVAAIISSPLKLSENTITLLLGEAEEEEEEEDEAYETDSSSDSEDDIDAAASAKQSNGKKLSIDVDLGLSPWANARSYYGERKQAAVKEQKTASQAEIALKNAEQKIAIELKKGLKQEKPLLQPVRKQMWFEKFIWFISSDGYLVLGGKDAAQNEIIYRRYLKKGDVYVHADLHGAPTVVIKNNPQTPDAPIPPSTLSQAGHLSVCASSAWDSKAGMGAYWVNADQVSKSAPTGEFLPTGSFMIRGKKNFLPPAQLILGFGIMFKISEESKSKHVKHRLHEGGAQAPVAEAARETIDDDTASHDGHSEVADHTEPEDEMGEEQDKDHQNRANPLQSSGEPNEDADITEEDSPPAEEMSKLDVQDPSSDEAAPANEPEVSELDKAEEQSDEEEDPPATSTAAATSGKVTPQPQAQKKQQPKRGQRGKAKKIAAKYKDQDDEDRVAIEALIGATSGQKKAEAEAKAKAEREAAQLAAKERRRAQHQKQQRETAEHEEVRKMMLEEGVDVLEPDEAEKATPLDSLVGAPMVGDEILEAVVVCGPYSALGKLKYKVKLQPGAQKKGKAIKEILEGWKAVSTKKGVLDEKSQDKERMWPREVELLKALKPEEAVNTVPVGKVRVMVTGGASGGGGAGDKGKGGKGGGKGKKR